MEDNERNYVKFYRGSKNEYDSKVENEEVDENGIYFIEDEETGQKKIYVGQKSFGDTSEFWPQGFVISSEGTLQQVSKDSTDYNAHFEEDLNSLEYGLTEDEINENLKTLKYLMCFNTLNEMKESPHLLAGMTAMLKVNGGGSFYHIRYYDHDNDTPDDYNLVLLDNFNIAELIELGSIEYSINKNYVVGDVVYSSKKLYICIAANGPSTTVRALSNTAYWQVFKISSSGSNNSVAVFNSDGKLVFPNGSLLWIE